MINAPGFVGRERELRALARALAVPPAVVAVEGEAGIGKSRLMRELLAADDELRRRSLVAYCPPFRQPHTLGPLVEALRDAPVPLASLSLSPLAGALRPLFPEWADDLPPPPEPAEDLSAARHRLYRALAELIERLGVTLLVVEDAHWADDATLEFMLFLASAPSRPVSLATTYRPHDLPADSTLPLLSSRQAPGAVRLRLALEPLDVSQTSDMVSTMLAGEHVSEEFAAFLYEHTDGVPLAVEESVRLLSERADLTRRGNTWVRRHLDAIEVPPSIRDSVRERVSRLAADTRAVLAAVATLTDPATEAVIAETAGLPDERTRDGLAEGLTAGLLREDRRGLVSFGHALVCRAVYESVPAPDRRVLHGRAGHALENAKPLPVARLASHFRESGDTESWCSYGERAADQALDAGDEATAILVLHDLVTTADLPARTAARLVRKTPFAAFSAPGLHQDLCRALRAILDSGALEPDERAEVRLHLGRTLISAEEWPEGRLELELAVPGLGHDPVGGVMAMTQLAWPRGTMAPATEHVRWLRRAVASHPPMAPAEDLHFRMLQTVALLMLGQQEGWAMAEEMLRHTPATSGERLRLANAWLDVGDVAMRWGRHHEARVWLATAMRVTESGDYRPLHDTILATQFHLDWYTGTWAGLDQRTAALAGKADEHPVVYLETNLVRGLLATATEAPATAEERLETSRAELLSRGAIDYFMEPAAALARMRLGAGDIADALRLTDEPIAVTAAKGIWVWAGEVAPVRVDALVAAGRQDDAAELVNRFGRGLRGRDAPGPRAGLALSRAVLAEGRGEPARAARLFARAAAAWQALPQPYQALLARERQAHCLLAAGDSETGLQVLRDTMDGLSTLGASRDATRVAAALRQHGVEVRQPRRGGWPGYGDRLSPRELDVARLLVRGITNRGIAAELFLSPKTVARHIDSAMRKLGVTSRTALAVRVVEAGLGHGESRDGVTSGPLTES